ncbi:complex I NDUFA9 subunit family protein [Acetobacter senegalensis]|uniref:complex I NDUFA9 subunit family protein n=1 Tax=Acetobacter senegalensis TaxID=446692 RepID=UPI00128D3CB7|nr:complex I NDUFA9 subunit family protein [Acetobacter senegalensis]MCG4255640.1 complex I NDUFA9 subunit family protein [Acetobacter senegalensis]MCG4265547.1 complex I NDUFA9 subunit family protein [Acetobacter senegalensis]MPQ73290.1 NAD(P)H-binding protein [Acetobacter senegalensis]
MSTGKIATVLGGNGFVGQYVVQNLAEAGYTVRVASRRPDRATLLRPLGRVGQIAPFYASVLDDASVAYVVEGASIVVNLVGVLGSTSRQGLEAVNVLGAERVARLSAAAGVDSFVQMSALGASPSAASAYGRSRAAGEDAVRRHLPHASIVRPSIIFGPEDHFFNLFGTMARYLPILPVYGANTRVQPVFVGDVAQALARIALDTTLAGKIWSLGGPEVLTMRQIYQWVLKETQRDRLLFTVPSALASLQASIFERLPGKLITRDQLRMLSEDNVVPPGQPGFEELGIAPRSIENTVPFYLDRYRAGGGRSGVMVPE